MSAPTGGLMRGALYRPGSSWPARATECCRNHADGGFGLVETCAAHVSQDGKTWEGELGVHDDAMLEGLSRLAARIHQGGALASVQLFHGGLRASQAVSGIIPWSPSPRSRANAPSIGTTTRPKMGGSLRCGVWRRSRVPRASR